MERVEEKIWNGGAEAHIGPATGSELGKRHDMSVGSRGERREGKATLQRDIRGEKKGTQRTGGPL